MRANQVVTECPGPLVRAIRIGSSQQVFDEIAPQPQLYLAGRLQMRELQAEHGICMLESNPLAVSGASMWIN
jgi:hypothetical protein